MTSPVEAQEQILQAMSQGHFLKSHRDIDGHKAFRLHPLRGEAVAVAPAVVEDLRRQGLIDSNKKFPVATFWLTEKGRLLADSLR